MTRLLITGPCGFLGAHLVEHFLKNTDFDIVGLDRLSYASSGFDRLRDIKAYDDKRVHIIGCDLSHPLPEGVVKEVGDVDYVIHAAAETHVDNSIVDPVPFIQSNVMGTHNLLWWAKVFSSPKLKRIFLVSTDEVYGPASWDSPGNVETDTYRPANPYAAAKAGGEMLAFAYANTYRLPLTIVNCWDMATQVLGEHGPLSYDDVRVGDKVWTLDVDENLVLVPVLDKVRMPSTGEMVSFDAGVSQLVTPNHRMMFRESTGSPRRWGSITEAPASQLATKVPSGRVQFVRTGVWLGDTRDIYVTSELIPRIERGGNCLPDRLPASWLARFFGWFITEGSTNGKGQVRLAGSKEGQQAVLRDLFEEIGMERIGSDDKAVYVSSFELSALAELCGGKQDTRRVPMFIKQMAREHLDEFIEAAIAGDGTWYANAGRIYTMHKALAYDYAEIGMKCGLAAKVSSRTTKTFDGSDTSQTYYTCLSQRPSTDVGAVNIKQVPYSGDVWCVKVATGRVFTTRNDSGIVLTGQTMNLYGERQGAEKFIPLVIRRVLEGEKILIHADPTKTRAGTRFYIHCRNYASALSFLIKTDDRQWILPPKIHVAGECEVSNLDLAQTIADILGKPLNYEMVDFHSSRPGHDLRYALDDKLIRSMGWKQPVDFKASLERTVRWFVDNPRWLNIGIKKDS